jgi:2-polyprenyl-3-methyl-5-hydroxy-6-metoxy-1,4-benzoquinol methylase
VREGRIPSRRAGTDDAILSAVMEHSPKRVLDAGCGEGWLARQMAESGIDVVAFDGSAPLIEKAQPAGGAQFKHLSYDEFVSDAARAGRDFDVAVFNFSLFTADIVPTLRAARDTLQPDGALIIQTVHPFNDAEGHPYQDGWREEDFATMDGAFRTVMPWFFRTMSSWVNAVISAGYQLRELREPPNESTGKPLSLLIIAQNAFQ